MVRRSLILLASSLALPCHLAAQNQGPSREERLRKDGIIWGSAAAWSVPYAPDLPADIKIAGLSRFWAEARTSFPNFADIAALDWDSAYVATIPLVRASSSTYEYYRVLQRFAALLTDGHSGVFFPREIAATLGTPPLDIESIEHRAFITGVRSARLQAEGVTPRLEITEVDGKPVAAYADAERRPYLSSNSPAHRDVLVYSLGLLEGPRTTPVRLRLRAPDGRTFERVVAREGYDDATLPVPFAFRMLPGNIAYAAVNTFANDSVLGWFTAHLPEIRASRGLIIDVRQNGGGSGVLAYNLLGYLSADSFPIPRWKSRQYIATYRAWGTPGGWFEAPPQRWPGRGAEHFGGPVIVLAGPRSMSATDVFVASFRDSRRGQVAGEPTAGSTGDPVGFGLPGGGSGRVATSATLAPVPPDLPAPRTVTDFLAGRDAALEAALAALAQAGR